MMDELLTLWAKYILTERYKNIKTGAKASSMGMGFMFDNVDTFEDFMAWCKESSHE